MTGGRGGEGRSGGRGGGRRKPAPRRYYPRRSARPAGDEEALDRDPLAERPLAADADGWVVEHDDSLRDARRPDPVGDVLGAFLSSHGWDERIRGAQVFGRWSDLVGPELARRCEPVRLAGGQLVVRAESAAWATEVRYLTPEVVRRASEVLGPGLVREVHLVVGPLEGTAGD